MEKQYVVFYQNYEPDYCEAHIFDNESDAINFFVKSFDKEYNEAVENGCGDEIEWMRLYEYAEIYYPSMSVCNRWYLVESKN